MPLQIYIISTFFVVFNLKQIIPIFSYLNINEMPYISAARLIQRKSVYMQIDYLKAQLFLQSPPSTDQTIYIYLLINRFRYGKFR